MFSQILDEVELRWFSTGAPFISFFAKPRVKGLCLIPPDAGKSVITPLLEAILGSKFPLPGQSFEFPVVSYKQYGFATLLPLSGFSSAIIFCVAVLLSLFSSDL